MTRTADRAQDVEELLEGGVPPEDILRRLDVRVGAMARSLHRLGRHDLASRFERARLGLCVDCRTPIHWKSDRCVSCANPIRPRDANGRFVRQDRCAA